MPDKYFVREKLVRESFPTQKTENTDLRKSLLPHVLSTSPFFQIMIHRRLAFRNFGSLWLCRLVIASLLDPDQINLRTGYSLHNITGVIQDVLLLLRDYSARHHSHVQLHLSTQYNCFISPDNGITDLAARYSPLPNPQ